MKYITLQYMCLLQKQKNMVRRVKIDMCFYSGNYNIFSDKIKIIEESVDFSDGDH